MTFQVIIRGRNCKKYLGACLESLIEQYYTDWKATLILDHPSDGSEKIGMEWASKDPRITLWVNKKRKGLASNMWRGMKYAEAGPEDVIAWLDADDMLHERALKIVALEYEKRPNLLATHGSYRRTDTKRRTKISKKYDKSKSVREQPWRGSHLKTFKYKLMKHFPKKYLKNSKKKWYDAASDIALMLPILELAGLKRVKFIRKEIYKWRMTSQAIYKDKTGYRLQQRNKKEIYAKKPLKRVVF